jgi:hypothetical protein
VSGRGGERQKFSASFPAIWQCTVITRERHAAFPINSELLVRSLCCLSPYSICIICFVHSFSFFYVFSSHSLLFCYFSFFDILLFFEGLLLLFCFVRYLAVSALHFSVSRFLSAQHFSVERPSHCPELRVFLYFALSLTQLKFCY